MYQPKLPVDRSVPTRNRMRTLRPARDERSSRVEPQPRDRPVNALRRLSGLPCRPGDGAGVAGLDDVSAGVPPRPAVDADLHDPAVVPMLRIGIELVSVLEPEPRAGRQLDALGHGHGRVGDHGRVVTEQVERARRRPRAVPGGVVVGVLGVVPGVAAAMEHVRVPERSARRGVLEVVEEGRPGIRARGTGRGDPRPAGDGQTVHLGRPHRLLDGVAVRICRCRWCRPGRRRPAAAR